MASMQNEESGQEGLREKVLQYINDRIVLLKMEAAEKVAKLASAMAVGAIMALLFFMLLLFLSLVAAYLFAQITHSLFIGFGIVAGSYILLVTLMFTYGRKAITRWVSNEVVKVFFEEETEKGPTDESEE